MFPNVVCYYLHYLNICLVESHLKKVNNKNDKNNTAKMNIPSVNPHLDINDQSQVDESITQSDSPIYNTGTIN